MAKQSLLFEALTAQLPEFALTTSCIVLFLSDTHNFSQNGFLSLFTVCMPCPDESCVSRCFHQPHLSARRQSKRE